MPFFDTIVLTSSHGLIQPHLAPHIPMKVISDYRKDNPIETASFGLFDSSSPNYTNYYPDVKASDLIPQADEIFMPVVRALSEVVVHKTWQPVDFSRNNVLKNSVAMLNAQSVYVDHETALGNALGVVYETFWEDSYKTKSGQTVPAGINARLKIDGKSNPRLVRLMNMDPPAVHSLSVTVRFGWEPSHKGIPTEEFLSKLGTFDKDGNLYTRVATSIQSYSELSWVGHGADPYAQIIKDGAITNPKYADMVYHNSETGQVGLKHGGIDFGTLTISNSAIPTPINNNNTNPVQTDSDMKSIIALLALTLGYKLDNTKPDAEVELELLPKLQEYLTTSGANASSLEKLTGTNQSQEQEITQLKASVEELKGKLNTDPSLLAAAKKYQESLTADIKRLAAITGQAESTYAELVESGEVKMLEYLRNTLSDQVEQKFPIKCQKCNSTEVTRASAETPPLGTETPAKLSFVDKRRKKNLADSITLLQGKDSVLK